MLKITSHGIPELMAWLNTLVRGIKITAVRAFDEYLIGDETHGLKHNPARVEHGPNNPYRWQSDKQRKAYFATGGFGGGIPYTRTGGLAAGWKYTEQDSNYTTSKIYNEVPSARYVQGRDIQRGHIADGWRTMWDVISTNLAGAKRHAQAKVKEYLATHRRV
jgi:hypothetical protein